jgi:DNA repair protein RecN (Recombination protein N)
VLRQLAIRNVVLVDQLELEFEAGLGVLTGETGAGKSILLDALGLALGARSDTGLVRSGSEGSTVSAEIDLPAGHPVHALLVEQGIDVDRGEPLILRRTLKADGGSRAFVGAATVPAGLLREIGALAVEIHGQHDERGLLNPRGHRALLDALLQGAGQFRKRRPFHGEFGEQPFPLDFGVLADGDIRRHADKLAHVP